MKKIFFLLATALLLVSCADEGESDPHDAIIEQALLLYNTETGEVEIEEESVTEADPTVDFDLTSMSSTMVYSVVADMIYNSSHYVEKSFKMQGVFESFYSEEYETQLHFVVINDALGCCPQGLELKFTDDAEIPEPLSEVTIKGVMGLEKVGESTFMHIEVTEILTTI